MSPACPALAIASLICSSWHMHSAATSFQNLAASSARGFVVAGNNNNRANNNANFWRADA